MIVIVVPRRETNAFCQLKWKTAQLLVMSTLSDDRINLLISGYVREKEKQLILSMNVPYGIVKLIHDLYPLLIFKFGDYDKEVFELDEDKTILKGNNPEQLPCYARAVYADLGQYSDIGLNEGVHLWSVKSLTGAEVYFGTGGCNADCFLSIGVTSEKKESFLTNPMDDHHWVTRKSDDSYFQGHARWSKDCVITVKLDCNDWSVTYYQEGKQIKRDSVNENKSYYFAVFACAMSKYTHLQIVDNPDEFN